MQTAKCKLQNGNTGEKEGLRERLLNFAAETIKIVEKMHTRFAGREIAGQVISSSSSAGANYEEACGAESRSDFVHKMQIVLKKLKESSFWFRLMVRAELVLPQEIAGLSEECKELSNIIGKSIITAKKNKEF